MSEQAQFQSSESELEERVQALEEKVGRLENMVQSEPEVLENSNTMRDFVKQVEPSNHDEKAVAIAYYLENHERNENFTMDEIEDGYRKCKFQKYSNYNMLAKRLADDEGWLMRDGKEGQKTCWVLTAKGEEFVEERIRN